MQHKSYQNALWWPFDPQAWLKPWNRATRLAWRLRAWAARLDSAFARPEVPTDIHVSHAPNGDTLIRLSALDAARLAGRREFGHIEEVQDALRDRIAGAWYAADCTPAKAGAPS